MTYQRKEIIGDCTLYLGDCLEVMPTLGKVDAVVTSPPYAQQRDYGQKISDWRLLVSGCLTSLQETENTQFLINLGLIHKDGRVIRYWDDLINDMEKHGFRLFGWYVWDKLSAMPGDSNGRLGMAHEWVFHFNKNSVPVNKTVATKYAGVDCTKGSTGLRGKNGKMTGWTQMGKPVQDYKVADSVIREYPQRDRTGPEKDHPAVYPIGIPNILVSSYTQENEMVLDPFMGSGTTGVSCAKLGRKFIGIELEPKYFDIACRRIEEAYKQPDLFIEPPKKIKQEAFI